MTLADVIDFQFGRAKAIQTVARERTSIYAGLFLVLLTGVARNYDQRYFGEEGHWWILVPLVFSLFSGTFIFLVLYKGFIHRHLEEQQVRQWQQWRSFMGLFWMTAPIAWLYAIPVERLFNPVEAARLNLTFLGIVSVWRVLLMTRVLNLIQGISFRRALTWVVIGASLETLLIIVIGGVWTLERRVLTGMAGMRNAPEENLVLAAITVAFHCSWVALVLAIVGCIYRPLDSSVRPFPTRLEQGSIPWASFLIATCAWVLIALSPQKEQQRFEHHKRLVDQGEYQQAIDYLSQHQRADFPPNRRLEPNPYEPRVFEDLPKLVAQLKPTTPAWVRELYLEYSALFFSHRYLRAQTETVLAMLKAIERLPEGQDWLAEHQSLIEERSHFLTKDVTPALEAEIQNLLKRNGASTVRPLRKEE